MTNTDPQEENQYYHLIVSLDENAFKSGEHIIARERCLIRYTSAVIKNEFGKLDESVVERISKFPCLLAYEDYCKRDAYIAKVNKIVVRELTGVKFCFELIGRLSFDDLHRLAFELDIDMSGAIKELNHTHWTIKKVNLNDVLPQKLPSNDDNAPLQDDDLPALGSLYPKVPCSLFLSYCSKEADIADIIDENLSAVRNVTVSRDTRDVAYRESFKDFMKQIKKHDYVVMLISDNFLKSQNCMYEVGELLTLAEEFKKRLLFIIISDDDAKYMKNVPVSKIGAKIYSAKDNTEYITYWETQLNELNNRIELIESKSAKIEPLKKLKEITRIIDQDLGQFLEFVSDANGRTFEEMYKSNFLEILEAISA